MSRTSTPTRAISVLLAFVLACTMFPGTSIAFAATADEADTAAVAQNDSTSPSAAEDVTDETTNASDVEASVQESAPTDAAAVPVVASEDKPLQTTTVAPEDVDMVSANVSLSDARTVLTSGNLTYTVNDDDASVTCTGWTGAAPKDALYIPPQVTVGIKVYKVTSVNISGGGHRPLSL